MVEGPEGHECSTAAGGAAAANVAPMMMTPTEGTARVRLPGRPSKKAERNHGGRNADRLGLDLAEKSDLTERPVNNGDKGHRRREDLQGNTKLSTL